MKKKFVYLFETGGLSKATNNYHFYDTDIYSSQKKVDDRIRESIEINKGYDLEVEEFDSFKLYTYSTVCVEGNKTKVRYKVTRKEIR